MRKLLLLIIFLPIMTFSQNRIFTQFYFDNDNEAQNSYKYYLGYSNKIQDNLQLGVSGGFRNYIMPNFSNTYKDLRFETVYSPTNNFNIIGNISFLFSNQWNPVFVDGLLSYSPIKLLYFEGYFERESVGSALANNQKLISTFFGLSTDINIADNIVWVVGFSDNSISGDNRFYQNYRIVYTLPFEWMFVDLRAKIMTGGDYSPYYFSPSNFGEYNVGIGINTKLFTSQYYMKLYFGSGAQTIVDDTKEFFISNIKLSADFTSNLSGELLFGISNSVSDSYGNYIYDYGKIQINYNF